MKALIARYLDVSGSLDGLSRVNGGAAAAPEAAPLPHFEGFRTIERIGTGGMGEVYKVHDLKLDRLVAAKIVRGERGRASGLADFLAEARAMALFQDRRIVQIHELRDRAEPPVLIMEYVDGFELGRLAPSLEFTQRARIMKEVCEAVQHAHDVGVQHRDLKPSNIMLDAELRPKILDFGLSSGDPARGHFRGTPRYLAPEQLDASQPIDARTDVYALGAVLYELLSGVPPVGGVTEDEIVANVRAGAIRLPVEIAAGAPEPLQAIALKALEARPQDRYQSARDMALDLARYLDGRPVTARPSRYASVLTARIRPHLEQVEDWLRLKLIHPHEAGRIQSAYRALERRDDDWIGESRVLSYSQIALYLGAFLLMCGSLYYFYARRFELDVKGVLQPFAVLAVPFAGLNVAAHLLERRAHKAVAVAFYLGGISLLPLFLLIAFHDQGLWVVAEDKAGQLFPDGTVSNTQLQVTVFVACAWTAWLAWRTRTIALSTVLAALVLLFTLAVLSDFGLRTWFDEERWDLLALHLLPLVPVYVAAGLALERAASPWFGRPLYTAAARAPDRDARTARAGRPPLVLPDRHDAGVPGRVGDKRHAPRHGGRLVAERRPVLPRRLARRHARHRPDEAGRMAAVHGVAVRDPRAAGVPERNRGVRPVLRLGLPRPRRHDGPPEPPAPAEELLLRRPDQHRRRALAHHDELRLVRQAVLGHPARRHRRRRPARRLRPRPA